MKTRKRLLSTLVAMAIIIGMLPVASFSEDTNDYETNWAKSEINYMKDRGILSGYPDGTFKPNNNMSKAEFYKVINGLFGFTKKADVKFSDVNSTNWYYSEVEKGLGANYIPAGRSLSPNENITRGEVARIIGIVFDVKENVAAANTFTDSASIPKELKGAIGGLKKNGYINGYPDGTFKAEGSITRAEVVKMIHDISGEIVNVAGTVSKDVKTNFVVNKPNVVLKDMTIAGNLYLTEGIGNGDVTLDNVVVKGELSIKGGGPNSIIIKNSTINTVSVDKASGLVRVVFENTTVEKVNTTKEVKIELTNGTVIKLVELDGKVEVAVEKGAAIVTVDVVSKEIIIDSKGTIESIKTSEEININGKTVKANTEHKVLEGKATDTTPKQSTPTTPTTSGGSSGGGGGGGGGTVTPRPSIEIEFENSLVYLGKTGHNPSNIKLNPSDATLTYVSNDTEVVTIDRTTGIMTGVGLGDTTVTVTATRTGYKTTTFTFKVRVIEEPDLPEIEVDYIENSVVFIGKTDHNPKINKIVPSDAILTYVSNDTSIVTIDKTTGKMTGVGLGETTITVTATKTGYRTKTFTINVEVIEEPFEEADITNVSAINGEVTVTFDKSTHIARERLTVTQAVYGEEPFEVRIGDILSRNEVYNLSIPKLGEEYIGKSIITSVSIDGKEPVAAEAFVVEKEETPVPVDKSFLEAKILEAEELNEADYTTESWEALEEALRAARYVLNDRDATQEEVDEALTALSGALELLVEEPVIVPEPEELTVAIDEITGNSNTLKGTFNKPVFVDGTALGSLKVETAEEKLAFLGKLFDAPADLGTYMVADKIVIALTDTSVEVTINDGAISKELFEALDADGNGIWRMDVELNKASFVDADDQTVADEAEAFKIKFSVPCANGIADYSVPVKAVFQTQDQRDAEGDDVVAPEELTVEINEITGDSNTLKGTFNKPVFVDEVALGSIKVETAEEKLAFLGKLFDAPADLSTYMVADKIVIALTDISVEVTINDGAISGELFSTLDGDKNGIWRMDVELKAENFKDIHGQTVAEVAESFKIKFTSYSNKYLMGDLIDYSADPKAVFQTQAQRDEEPYEKEVTLSVKPEATVTESVVTMTTNTPIGTNLYPWSGNGALNAFTKDGAFMLVRLFKIEGETKNPVFFNTVFDSVNIAPGPFGGLTYKSSDAAGTRAGGDFSNLGSNSTQLFSDKGIKDSQFAGALIYNVKTTDIYSLWLPAGSIDLTLTNVLKEAPAQGEYVIYFEAYGAGYKDASTDTKWSNEDELPLLGSVKVIEFTIE